MADFYSVNGSRINPATGKNWTEAEFKSRPSYVARKERIRQEQLRHREEFEEAERAGNVINRQVGASSLPLAEVVKEVVGDLDSTNAIISNFISQHGGPVNVRDHFFQVLESWETSLPLNEMWMVFFTVPDIVNDEVMEAWGEHLIKLPTGEMPGGGIQGPANFANETFVQKELFTRTHGCALAQTVQIPQEQVNIDHPSIPNSRGFIANPIITQRQRFASLNIEFLETNISFVDFLLRPWTVVGSHLGAVARAQAPITSDVILINFSRAGFDPAYDTHRYENHVDQVPRNKRGFVPRKVWVFSDCQPINIDSHRVTYSQSTDVDRRTVEWMFRRYQCYLPYEVPGLFRDIHEQESKIPNQSAEKMKRTFEIWRPASRGWKFKLAQSANQFGFNWWDLPDGQDDDGKKPLDSENASQYTGDGRLSPVKDNQRDTTVKDTREGPKKNAEEYWKGDIKIQGTFEQYTIDDQGYENAPEVVWNVPQSGTGTGGAPGQGWDKEIPGELKLASENYGTGDGQVERPYGHTSADGTGIGSYNEATAEALRYGSGAVDWNKNLNETDTKIEVVDPAKSKLGGTWGPDGGPRYQVDTHTGYLAVARPFGAGGNKGLIARGVAPASNQAGPRTAKESTTARKADALQEVKMVAQEYGMGSNPARDGAKLGGTYGPTEGARYQMNGAIGQGLIKAVGRGAGAYRPGQDFLSAIFGI